LAKDRGAHVIGSDSSEKAAFLQELGVDQIVNAHTQPFDDVVCAVDVVLNYARADLLERSYTVLKPGGRYATTLEQPPREEAERRGIPSFGVFTQPTIEHLTALAKQIDAGKLKVFVNRTFPLHDAQAALDYRQTGATSGKVVLTVN
jgi:NADPH:quinone reductase-like Zn-dependent oxidoreductase